MDDTMPERWLPVVGYEGLYEVSDLGRVRSLDRLTRGRWGTAIRRGRILRPAPGGRMGYLRATLYGSGTGPVRKRQRGRDVHKLVLEAFVGPRPKREGFKYEARHLDGNPANNALANLTWGTCQENWEDRRRHGQDVNSAKTHCPRGHPYDEANTRIRVSANGGIKRECKACTGRGPYRQLHRRVSDGDGG